MPDQKKIPAQRVIIYGENQWDKGIYPFEIDPITRGINSIDTAHHQLHEGYAFTAYYVITTAATNSHRSGLYIKTSPADENSARCHMVASFASSTAANLSICESPTIAANVGTHTNLIYNRFRDSSYISKCSSNATIPLAGYFTTLTEAQIAADGTWATGTILRTEPMRFGTGPNPAGGTSRATQEYILKTNTKYVFLLTNTTADANTHHIFIDWYEHRNLTH